MKQEFDLDHIFTFHAVDAQERAQIGRIRQAARVLAESIAHTPPGSDRDVAMQKVREAVMFANAAVSLGGRLHKVESHEAFKYCPKTGPLLREHLYYDPEASYYRHKECGGEVSDGTCHKCSAGRME